MPIEKDRSVLFTPRAIESSAAKAEATVPESTGDETDDFFAKSAVKLAEAEGEEVIVGGDKIGEKSQTLLVSDRRSAVEQVNEIDRELLARGTKLNTRGSTDFADELGGLDSRRNRSMAILEYMKGHGARRLIKTRASKATAPRVEPMELAKSDELRYSRFLSSVDSRENGRIKVDSRYSGDVNTYADAKLTAQRNAISSFRKSLFSKILDSKSSIKDVDVKVDEGVKVCKESKDVVVCSGILDALDIGALGMEIGLVSAETPLYGTDDDYKAKRSRLRTGVENVATILHRFVREY